VSLVVSSKKNIEYFKEVSDYFEMHGLEPPIGSLEKQIAELESSLGDAIPYAYKEYLLFMGQDNDGIMRGTNCFLSVVESNNDYLPELLENNKLSGYKILDKGQSGTIRTPKGAQRWSMETHT
jgi:hypothetical protein